MQGVAKGRLGPLRDVLQVQGLTQGLVSVGQLALQHDACVVFSKDRAYVIPQRALNKSLGQGAYTPWIAVREPQTGLYHTNPERISIALRQALQEQPLAKRPLVGSSEEEEAARFAGRLDRLYGMLVTSLRDKTRHFISQRTKVRGGSRGSDPTLAELEQQALGALSERMRDNPLVVKLAKDTAHEARRLFCFVLFCFVWTIEATQGL